MKVYKLTEENFDSLELERLYDTEWCDTKSYYDISNILFDGNPITYLPYLMTIEDGYYIFTHRRRKQWWGWDIYYLLKHRGELIVIDDNDEISTASGVDGAIIHDALLDSSIEDMVGYLRLTLSL